MEWTMERKGTETMVGLFVLAGFVAIGYLALKAANLTTFTIGETYPITAKFDNIGGLKLRAPVRSAGVKVGRVVAIEFDNQSFQGSVTMEIEEKFRFPKDTSAKILTAGLLGDQYIGLEPGGDEKDLEPGDAIRMTQSAVVLENLISQFLFNKAAEGKGGEAGK
jgi:phospholipid/cholesterol/gamma-HCH transport system substrate-binding protein